MSMRGEDKDPNCPTAYGGCACQCHRVKGVSHVMPCCYPPGSPREGDRNVEHPLAEDTPHRAAIRVATMMEFRLNQKGWGGSASTHEGYGIIAEELDELMDALRENDIPKIKKECLDIAVAAMYLYESAEQETFSRKT